MNSQIAFQEIKKGNPLAEINEDALKHSEEIRYKEFRRNSKGQIDNSLDPNELKKHLKNTCAFDYSGPEVIIGKRSDIDDQGFGMIYRSLKNLSPWRKGPFSIYGIEVDAEWRCDLKWERIERAITPCENKIVLDIGANNGYFMYRLLNQKPKFVLGIDPVASCIEQYNFLNSLNDHANMHMAPWGINDVKHFKNCFDVILFMGIIYHHKHPLEQLEIIKDALRPGGILILETIGIPGEEPLALFPKERFANMKNVYFVPTLSCLTNWATRCHFEKIEVISKTPLTPEEQRVTEWSHPKSLINVLDPSDPSKTIEGYPAPWRFAISCQKKII